MALIFDIPWTSPPTERARANLGGLHGITLHALAQPNVGWDAAQGLPLGRESASTLTTTRSGVAVVSPSATGRWCYGNPAGQAYTDRGLYTFNTVTGSLTGDYSALIVFAKPSGTADAIYALGSVSSGGAFAFMVQFYSGDTYPILQDQESLNTYYSGTTTTVSSGDVLAFLFTLTTSGNSTCYVRNLTTGSENTISLGTLSAQTYGGFADYTKNMSTIAAQGSVTGYTSGLPVLLDARWRRRIDEGEAKKILRNPYALYSPKRLLLPASAGAALPTLSAARAKTGSITSLGWVSQVTAS